MNFQFNQQKLDKELILKHISEEQIMEYYLKVPIKKGLFRSSLRSDKNPTCSFYRNSSGTLIFKDFATGQSLSCFGVVQELFKCNYFQALKIIANDFGIIENKNIKKNQGKINENPVKIEDKQISRIQVEIQEFSDQELNWWGKYGITLDILKKFNVFSCKHVFLNGNLFTKSQQHCPSYGYYGGNIKENGKKIELWRIYYPKRKNSFRFISNWPGKKIQGFKQLPKTGKLLVITKSMKDCLALYAYNIPAIAPCSENLFISNKVLEELKTRFKHIIVLYDNDIPGIHNMRKIKKEYPELHYFFIPRHLGAKDFSDLRKLLGYKKTKELLIEFFEKFKKDLK